MQQNTAHKLQDCRPQPPQKVSRVRPDRGGDMERLVTAVEIIAEAAKQLVSVHSVPKHISPQTMSYEDAAVVTGISRKTLEKMVANGILKKGRHYIKGSASEKDKCAPVLFPLNLLELIFEDQLCLEEEEPAKEQPETTTRPRTPKTVKQTDIKQPAVNLDL